MRGQRLYRQLKTHGMDDELLFVGKEFQFAATALCRWRSDAEMRSDSIRPKAVIESLTQIEAFLKVYQTSGAATSEQEQPSVPRFMAAALAGLVALVRQGLDTAFHPAR